MESLCSGGARLSGVCRIRSPRARSSAHLSTGGFCCDKDLLHSLGKSRSSASSFCPDKAPSSCFLSDNKLHSSRKAINLAGFWPMDQTKVCEDFDSMDDFLDLANKLADAAAKITLQYFRTRVQVMDKHDLSPVTIADQAAEEIMRAMILKRFPSHSVVGEEGGTTMGVNSEYVWVLDPIDGTKSFITGKPVFGTLIALVRNGCPILGIIDQPVMKERWVGRKGHKSLLNNQEIKCRSCNSISSSYLYTTSPHYFTESSEKAFARVRDKVKIPLYGCDCYAYGLLAAGYVDLVVESGLKPYDYLALIPVIEGAGGVITDWRGDALTWTPESPGGEFPKANVIAAGDPAMHSAALELLSWDEKPAQ